MPKRRAFRRPKASWLASLGVFLGLLVELGIWFVPFLIRAIKERAYSVQFCLVLSTDVTTGCVQVQYQHAPGGIGTLYRAPDETPDRQGTLDQRQKYTAQYQVGYEYRCYYTGRNRRVASFAQPKAFNGLYLSIIVALCLLTLLMLCLYMASLPALAGQAPAAVFPAPAVTGKPPEPDAINKEIVQALRDSDENLKKRIVALATKLENERDARLELAQRMSQTAELVPQSAFLKSPLEKRTKANTVVPFDNDLKLEAV